MKLNSFSKTCLQVGQWTVTAGIFCLLVWLIGRDFGRFKEKLANNFLVAHIRQEREHVKNRARLMTLNQFMPHSYGSLLQWVHNPSDPSDRSELFAYRIYYEKLVEYMPYRADGYALLGLCDYLLGKTEEAAQAYQTAIQLNPNFFLSYYNLVVIYFHQGRYPEAIPLLEKALQMDLQHTLNFIFLSKVYLDIVRDSRLSQEAVVKRIREAYMDIYIMLVVSLYQTKNFPRLLSYAQQMVLWNFPHKDFFNYYAGLAAYELGQYPQAIAFFQKALNENPSYAPAVHSLGLTWQALGEEEKAAMAFHQEELFQKSPQVAVPLEKEIHVRIF